MAVISVPTPATRDIADIDAHALARALRAEVRGEVRFDAGTRALYATDASNYRQVPIGVVVPRDIDDVVAAVAVCHRFGAPILSRGGGTSLGGQCTNVAVMLDMAKYVNRVESIDTTRKVAVVQAGIVLDELNWRTRDKGGLVFGPKPATHDHCTIGGMLGNNSCGATAQWSGTTAANLRRLEILTYDGTRIWVGPTSAQQAADIERAGGRAAEIYHALQVFRDRYRQQIRTGYPRLPRRISGYNLPDLLEENGFNVARALVGSESTCVTILRAELDLLPEPTHVALVLVGYADVATAAAHVQVADKHAPYVVEGLDHKLIQYETDRRMNTLTIHDIPDAGAWLMVKVAGGSDDEARTNADKLLRALRKDGDVTVDKTYDDPAHIAEIDSVREAALGATARVPGYQDTWPGWEDSAVPPARLADYLRDLEKLLEEYGYQDASLYGHFGHGCVHTSIPFDLTTLDGISAFRSFVTRAARLVHSYGGSLSGEHGDGQARGELLEIMFGAELVQAMREFKAIWDPDGKMNPGKVVDAHPLDSDLRLGLGWPTARPDSLFSFPDDGGFAGVPTRCFGVGACRRHDTEGGGVMCPSYQVTREEKHSTRGRMRLLFEMMRGDILTDGWRSTEVNDALDLCLACKGCKSDCPVSVDVATYKAEFLAHHYHRRLRPRTHYSLGWLPVWARLAAYAPWAANIATQTPGLSRIVKAIAGVDPKRRMPRFTKGFSRRFRRSTAVGQRTVVLWPDTFSDTFAPQIPASAVKVLKAAGFAVTIPPKAVCCGLTWISTGQLRTAQKVIARSLEILAPFLEAGLPVVGLEPSCTSVLREDALRLMEGTGDQRLTGLARMLTQQTKTLAEFLDSVAPDFAPRVRPEAGTAIVQTHCHQHAVLGDKADTSLMKRIGLDATVLNSGCCGLAGDFGMSAAHRDVSFACAERVLFPALRAAEPATQILADGFSCRLQIAHSDTGKVAVHLAEILAAAIEPDQP